MSGLNLTDLGYTGDIFNAYGVLDRTPNAVAAYSVRKLNSQYTGSCFVIRRGTDNVTSSIGFKGYDLDTNAMTSFLGTSSGYVVTWFDQSGNNNYATQATNVSQPLIYSGSLLTGSNSLPLVRWNGNNTMATTGSVNLITAITTYYVASRQWSNAAYCSIISCQYGSSAGYAAIASTGGSGPDWGGNYAMSIGNGFNSGQSPKSNGPTFPITDYSWHLFDSILSATTSSLNKDGSSIVSLSNTNSVSSITGQLNLGNDPSYSDNMIGDISEILLFSYAHNPYQQSVVRGNINNSFKLY
jgi:hypothetical protein